MGGRGASAKFGGQIPTKATAIENMNEAQLSKEISKAQKEIWKYKKQRQSIVQSAEEKALQEAFPLGAGGLSQSEAQKLAGGLAEKALEKSKKLINAIDKQEAAEKRLSALENAQKKVSGSGKTLKEINDEAKKASTVKSTRKWVTTQKKERHGSTLQARIIESGDYKIVGNAILRVYKGGKEIGMFGSLTDAKSFVEKYDNR